MIDKSSFVPFSRSINYCVRIKIEQITGRETIVRNIPKRKWRHGENDIEYLTKPHLMFSLSYTTPRLSASSCEIRSPTYSITKSPFFNPTFVKRPHPASLIVDLATKVWARLPMLMLSLRHLCPSPAGLSGGSLHAPHDRQRSGSHSRFAA